MEERETLIEDRYKIKSVKKPKDWENGFFTGNGTIGGVLFFNHGKENFLINHENLFLKTNIIDSVPNMKDIFSEVRELFSENKGIEAAQLFYKKACERGLNNSFLSDGGLYPDSFFPAAELNILYSEESELKYSRCLNTYTAEINSDIGYDSFSVSERVFTSIKEKLVCMSIKLSEKRNITIFADLTGAKNDFERELLKKCIINKKKVFKEDTLWINVRMNVGSYCVKIKIATDGKVSFNGNIIIKNTKNTELFISVEVNAEPFISKNCVYEKLLKENICEYQKSFLKSDIIFSESEYNKMEIDELFDNTEQNSARSALFQKLYYMGRYLAVSSFGKLPPNAQGIWSGSVNGRLLCDYVTNIELPMAMWCLIGGNMFEKADCIFNFIDTYINDFRENAKKLFGMSGLVITSRMTTSGLMFHFSDSYSHEFWIAGAAWIAEFYYEYWQYTRDINFLKTKAYPFMCEAADFYMDYTDKNGNIIPSVSPENSPYEDEFCMAGKNAVMDISAIKELFLNLSDVCCILGIQNKHKIQLCDYLYDDDGTLLEWADASAAKSYSHRHISQVYPIMYGNEARHNEELKTGIEKSIEKRIENGFYEEENGTCGWSVMHLINTYARLGDSVGVSKASDFFIKHYLRKNMTACLNYSTTIFQIDANLGYVNVVYDMLVASNESELILLPCLSDYIRSGKAYGLPIKSGGIINELTWNNGIVSVVINSFSDKTLNIKTSCDETKALIKKNEIYKAVLNYDYFKY